MRNDEREAFAALLCGVMDTYQVKISESAIAVFWDCLKNFSLDDVSVALRCHCRENNRPPRPADLVQRIAPKRTSLEAWIEVVWAMGRYGAYRSVRFQDGIASLVIKDMGGWPWLCEQNIDEPWTQKEFERRYGIYAANGYQLEECLPGLHELHNTPAGLQEFTPEPALIGCMRQIHSNGSKQIGDGS